MRKQVDVLFITLSSPILIGIYENGRLIEDIKSDAKSSEVLPNLYKELLQRYEIKRLFYVNGPGSFMAIKIAYIFLKSMSILQKIPLFAADAFSFNQNQPVKAIGKLFFVKIASEIKTQKLQAAPDAHFLLPEVLEYDKFTTTTAPLYGIGAVG